MGWVVPVLLASSGCLSPAVVRQVQTQLVAEQVAAVPQPMAPLGVGAQLSRGQSSVLLGAALSNNRSTEPHGASTIGATVVPLLGVGRAAVALGDGLELVASGGAIPSGAEVPQLGLSGSDFVGVVGRGALGLRGFVGLSNTPLEWSFSYDMGAVAAIHQRTDTRTTTVSDLQGSWEEITVNASRPSVLVIPEGRLGTALSVPLSEPGIRASAALTVQSWPVFWDRRGASRTCTTYANGVTDCSSRNNLPARPSRLAAVTTPALGLSVDLDGLTLHGQARAHLGPDALGRHPFGGLLALERQLGARGVQAPAVIQIEPPAPAAAPEPPGGAPGAEVAPEPEAPGDEPQR